MMCLYKYVISGLRKKNNNKWFESEQKEKEKEEVIPLLTLTCCTCYLLAVKFEALANADTAHHILMYGCDGAGSSTANIWCVPFDLSILFFCPWLFLFIILAFLCKACSVSFSFTFSGLCIKFLIVQTYIYEKLVLKYLLLQHR